MSIYDTSVFEANPVADEKFVIKGEKFRITVLTAKLLRLEYSEDGVFEDRATRAVLNRNFDKPEFKVIDNGDTLEVITEFMHLYYDKKPFSKNGLWAMIGNHYWCYEYEFFTHGGTVRTLDGVDGAINMGDGLISNTNFSLLDDSETIAIEDNGWAVPGLKNHTDIYLFGYSKNYEECIKAFYKLSGNVPMLPRFALGNWWSRYHKYTDSEYRALMTRFEEENIPFSVAVMDMDWHITEPPAQYGGGWTGYTWDKELFPDHEDFLNWLHNRGMRVTLNLHPRDGIRAFEDCYEAIAVDMGVDPNSHKAIEFDVANEKFMDAYFRCVHNPMEEKGVDFWWIDWQQTGGTSVEDYDVLWMLNHYHFIDNARTGKKPLILSRYSGIGSHRYPIGFSGDTYISWASLQFQPFFTSTAANVGYSWWSHDIGGHHQGIKDNELQTRWLQLGVFSPILRLHSTLNDFNSREPWNYPVENRLIMEKFLRLRHKLIPYLYTMNYRNSVDGIPLVRPMYHVYPCEEKAFARQCEYFFGSELIVNPVTTPVDKETMVAKTTVWLPEGIWIDVFNGRIYDGNRDIDMFRNIWEIPVLAKTGAIVPMAQDSTIGSDTSNPQAFEINVFGGADGSFVLYEDNDMIKNMLKSVQTQFVFEWGKQSTFKICRADGDTSIIPQKRDYKLNFYAFENSDEISVTVNGERYEFDCGYDNIKNIITVEFKNISPEDEVVVTVSGTGQLPENCTEKAIFDLINATQMPYNLKEQVYRTVISSDDIFELSVMLDKMLNNIDFKMAILENLIARR
ncbi:MAG: glycoside hydrolase family 31 protein [bacterium]|nr:glycoside hydrolase family 31 protein [bacterium]